MGMIFDIQRCSYHDGPGVRTTVFFKGCGLRCAWCHNPESFFPAPQLRFYGHLCSRCGRCEAVCPNGVHHLRDGRREVDFSKCSACGRCAAVCPAGALSVVGQEVTVERIMDVVRRDKGFYDASGGGLTVSGGEPTLQGAFLAELLGAARAEGIHTCVETNGYIPAGTLAEIAPLTDLFLLDYKLSDDEGLKPYTRASGSLWQNTMDTLTAMGKPVILRLPVIPGINDTARHFEEAVRIRRAHSNVEAIEIMPYHSIGAAKWEQLGMTYSLGEIPTVPPEQAERWRQMLREQEQSLS